MIVMIWVHLVLFLAPLLGLAVMSSGRSCCVPVLTRRPVQS
jgi:hypothetical protein